MQKNILRTAALLGALAVITGAFGAHALEGLVESGKIEVKRLDTWHTAVQYQFYHTFALGLLALAWPHINSKFAGIARTTFIAGIALFSGSLYLLTLSPLFTTADLNWLGAITPLGGLLFITGWIFLFLSAKKIYPVS